MALETFDEKIRLQQNALWSLCHWLLLKRFMSCFQWLPRKCETMSSRLEVLNCWSLDAQMRRFIILLIFTLTCLYLKFVCQKNQQKIINKESSLKNVEVHINHHMKYKECQRGFANSCRFYMLQCLTLGNVFLCVCSSTFFLI